MKQAANRSGLGSLASVVRDFAVGICAILMIAASSQAQPVQLPEPPLPVDPRPLTQLISPAEKASLAESKPQKLIDAYLKISETHLQLALNLIRVNNHGAAERELDIYNKAVAAAGKEAFTLQDGRRSVSKRIEQVLYKQIKMLETIDRLFPPEREAFADAALKQTKQLRVQALNEAFASGDLLKDPAGEKKPKSEPPAKDGSPKDQTLPRPMAGLASRQTLIGHNPPAALPQASGPPARALSSRFVSTSTSRIQFHGYRGAAFDRALASILPRPQMAGDYLTEEEDDHVREAQAPDARTRVFMKIADRRLKAITGPAASPAEKKDQKKIEAEEKEWGAVPKVSRAELLRHYARAISECMAKLEDAYERNPKSSALPKALALLRDATDKHLETLRALKPELKTEVEAAAISGAINEAETANKGARDGLK